MGEYLPPHDPLFAPAKKAPPLTVGNVFSPFLPAPAAAPGPLPKLSELNLPLEKLTTEGASTMEMVRALRRLAHKFPCIAVTPSWLKQVADRLEALEKNGGCA